MKIMSHYQYGELTGEDLEAYHRVLKASNRLGISFVQMTREGGTSDGAPIVVGMTAVSEGNIVRGYSVRVAYVIDADYIQSAKKAGVEYRPLGSGGDWYITEFIDR